MARPDAEPKISTSAALREIRGMFNTRVPETQLTHAGGILRVGVPVSIDTLDLSSVIKTLPPVRPSRPYATDRSTTRGTRSHANRR